MSTNNVLANFGDFTNFETTFNRDILIGANPGTHTFSAYCIKNGVQAAQCHVVCTAGPSFPSPSWVARATLAL